MRTLLVFMLAALGAFCAYGYLASREPGVDPAWRVGYGALGVLALFTAWQLHRTGGDDEG